MTSVGDAFAWPFQDPGWLAKIVVQGLIFIIPILGWIALYGWVMMTIDNYRSGRRELPPAGFHLERGFPIFIVYLVYAIVAGIPGGVIQGAGSAGHSAGTAALGNLVSAVLGLALAFIYPALILHTYRGGFNAGFDISAVWQTATSNVATSAIAGILVLVAGAIGALGFCACCVGLLFTIPYGAAIIAGVVTWYEREITGPASMVPAPPV